MRKNCSQSLSFKIEHLNTCCMATIRAREDEIIERKKKDILFLKSRAFFFKSASERKKQEEISYTLPLECWGFK